MQQNFKRLVAWVHDFKADDAAQADRLARITADAVNTALKPLGHATAWAPMVSDGASGGDELMEILADCYVRDEVDDDPERVPRGGYVDVGETMIPERLMAWRDAAVKAATDDLRARIVNARAEIADQSVRYHAAGCGMPVGDLVAEVLAVVEAALVGVERQAGAAKAGA